MRLILDEDERIAAWVAPRIGEERLHGPLVAIGFERAGGLVGGLVFTGYTGANIEVTAAWTGPLTRGVLRVLRSYVFDQLGCRRLTIHTRCRNSRVVGQARRLGFQIEGRHPGLFPDDDGVSLGLLRENCTW